MRYLFILILFFSLNTNAKTFLFGHENLKLGMDKVDVIKFIKGKEETFDFIETNIIKDPKIYLIGGLEFNREIAFLYDKVSYIRLHTMVEYESIQSMQNKNDLARITYLFDKKANSLGIENNEDEVIIIEGKEKTYPQKSFYKNELGVEYHWSEVCLLNNAHKDMTRKYEFENSNLSMKTDLGNCFNRDDLFYLDITIYYWIDGMDIFMKEYFKENPPSKIIKNSNF
jgi:hypothetical protein